MNKNLKLIANDRELQEVISDLESLLFKFLNSDLPHYNPTKAQRLIKKYNNGYKIQIPLGEINSDFDGMFVSFGPDLNTKGGFKSESKEVWLYLIPAEELQDRETTMESVNDLKDYYTNTYRDVFRKQLEYMVQALGGINLSDQGEKEFLYTSAEINDYLSRITSTILQYIEEVERFRSDPTAYRSHLNSVLRVLQFGFEKFYNFLVDEILSDHPELLSYLDGAKKESMNIFRIRTRLKKIQRVIAQDQVKKIKRKLYKFREMKTPRDFINNFTETFRGFFGEGVNLDWFFKSEMGPELMQEFWTRFLNKHFFNQIKKLKYVDKEKLEQKIIQAHENLQEEYEEKLKRPTEEDLQASVFMDQIRRRIRDYSRQFDSIARFKDDIFDSEKTLFGYAVNYILNDYENLKHNKGIRERKEELRDHILEAFDSLGITDEEVRAHLEESEKEGSEFDEIRNISGDLSDMFNMDELKISEIVPFIMVSDDLLYENMLDAHSDLFTGHANPRGLYSKIMNRFLRESFGFDWLIQLRNYISQGNIPKKEYEYYRKFIQDLSGSIQEDLMNALRSAVGGKKTVGSAALLDRLERYTDTQDWEKFAKTLKDVHVGNYDLNEITRLMVILSEIPTGINQKDMPVEEETALKEISIKLDDFTEFFEKEVKRLEGDIEQYPEWNPKRGEIPREISLTAFENFQSIVHSIQDAIHLVINKEEDLAEKEAEEVAEEVDETEPMPEEGEESGDLGELSEEEQTALNDFQNESFFDSDEERQKAEEGLEEDPGDLEFPDLDPELMKKMQEFSDESEVQETPGES